MLSVMGVAKLGTINVIAPSLVVTSLPILVPLLVLPTVLPTKLPAGGPLSLVRASPNPRVLMGKLFSGVASVRGGLPPTTLLLTQVAPLVPLVANLREGEAIVAEGKVVEVMAKTGMPTLPVPTLC